MYSFFGSGKLHILKLGLAGLAIVVFTWSCSTTEKSTQKAESDTGKKGTVEKEAREEAFDKRESTAQSEIKLASYRSDMSDVYKSQKQTIPEAFAYRDTTEEVDLNPNAGFRIQIMATEKATKADSAASRFMRWYNSQEYVSTMGYRPDSYTFFKPPYYRVQVGDFKNRNVAIGFAQLVKQKYPDAWIVHERIELNRVPADSIYTYLREFR